MRPCPWETEAWRLHAPVRWWAYTFRRAVVRAPRRLGLYLRVGVGCSRVPLQGRADVRNAVQDVIGAVLFASLVHLSSNFFHVLSDLLVFLGEVFSYFLARENIFKRESFKVL